MTFNRSKAEKSLIQILKTRTNAKGVESPWKYEKKVIPLINPLLLCYFVESAAADSMYAKNKMYDVGIDFLDYSLRRELLLENISEFNIKLFEGKKFKGIKINLLFRTTSFNNYFRINGKRPVRWVV